MHTIAPATGRSGDFVVCAEVSQLFGEMIGVFVVHAWQRRAHRPACASEMGPVSGTMMADMLRVIEHSTPRRFWNSRFISWSNELRRMQQQTLDAHEGKISWHAGGSAAGLHTDGKRAIRRHSNPPQIRKTPTGFRERMVGLDIDGELTFAAGIAGIDPALLPEKPEAAPAGTLFDFHGPRGCDDDLRSSEGFRRHGAGDSLRPSRHRLRRYATGRAHARVRSAACPGEADLTSHVDFEDLAKTAVGAGLHLNGAFHQGDFLIGLGIVERAAASAAIVNRAPSRSSRARWTGWPAPARAGWASFFKAMAVSYPAVDLYAVPPGGLTGRAALGEHPAQSRSCFAGRAGGQWRRSNTPESLMQRRGLSRTDRKRAVERSGRRSDPPRLLHTGGRGFGRALSRPECRAWLERRPRKGDGEPPSRCRLVQPGPSARDSPSSFARCGHRRQQLSRHAPRSRCAGHGNAYVLGVLAGAARSFFDPENRVIGAAHAGWKGALTALENTVAAMERLGAKRPTIIACLGPSISQTSYVGSARNSSSASSHKLIFSALRSSRASGHAMFDLPA